MYIRTSSMLQCLKRTFKQVPVFIHESQHHHCWQYNKKVMTLVVKLIVKQKGICYVTYYKIFLSYSLFRVCHKKRNHQNRLVVNRTVNHGRLQIGTKKCHFFSIRSLNNISQLTYSVIHIMSAMSLVC